MQGLKPLRVKPETEDRVENREKDQPLSPMATMFYKAESNTYIVGMIGFKTEVNSDIIKANLTHTLLKQPRFSSVLVEDDTRNNGELRWVSTEVNLDYHMVVPKLNQKSIEDPDKFVEDYIYNLTKTTLDVSIPMWDFHILNLKTSDAESVCIIRVHHSLGDGTSLMSLLLACTRKVSDPEKLPTLPMNKKVDSASRFQQPHFLTRWRSMIVVFWNTVVSVVVFLATLLTLLKDTETPLKASKAISSSTPRRIVRRSLSLDDVKLVKNVMGVTVNDVMLGVTQAGLSRYLNRRYGERKGNTVEPKGDNNLPSKIRLRAVNFINNRASPGIQEVADMMKKGSTARWGNHIGYVLLPFTIALLEDPLRYVQDAKARMDKKKASLEASFSYYLAKYSLKFFGPKIASFPGETTMWFSNVPGPREEISLYGNPVAYIAPSCYGQPTTLLIHVVSYVNKITIILSVDDNIIPDPHQLCDDFEESLQRIKTAALAKRLV